MTKTTKLTRIAAAVALTLGFSGVATAETSSSMRGQIIDTQGQVVANTRVVIIHLPSGTVSTATTNDNGNFTATGLRVGGPYQVIIDNASFEAKTIDDIFLQLGSAYRLNAELEPQRHDNIERISVTGRAVNTTSLQAGSSSNWGEQEIRSLPTFNRDLKDIVRQNPLASVQGDDASSLTVGGVNPKFNSITVDGVGQNDDFGLASSGYPTQRSPISIDAIEQISIQSVPYNARYSGFTGARINAVTRSGTNEFFGSAFYEYSSDSLAGNPSADRFRDNATPPNLEFKEETWGFSLGGPILRDRLFFFVNYEKFEEPQSIQDGPVGAAVENPSNISQQDITRIQNISRDVYGFEPGTWDVRPQQQDEKILAKIDWNINQDHRASFTYQRTEGNSTRNVGSNIDQLKLHSQWYDYNQLLQTFSTQLYSNWTNNFSTEFKLSYKEVDNSRVPLLGKGAGDVRVYFLNEEGNRSHVRLGPDASSHGNVLSNETLELQFHGNYLLNEHDISFGIEYQEVDIYNLFVQNTLGTFIFDNEFDDDDNLIRSGIDNFEDRFAREITYQNAPSNNFNDAAAEFSTGTFAMYVQDTWDVTWDLTLNFGLRYERNLVSGRPGFNQRFFDRYGFGNDHTLDGESLWLPRASFNYELTDDITIRGGVGRFSGGRPNVWISNAFTNDGISIASGVRADNFENADITEVPQELKDSLLAEDGTVTPIDPNFKLPVDTRYSLAVDYSNLDFGPLGHGWFASAEVIYTQKDREVAWSNLSRQPLLDENGNHVTTQGGRPLYVTYDPLNDPDNLGPSTEVGGSNTDRIDIMLTNVSGGRSVVSTFSLGNAWDNGLSFRTSYSHQDVRDVTAGGSSTAWSNYKFQTAVDRENLGVGTASYQIEHRLMATLTYRQQFYRDYDTTMSLFFERTSGRPYSVTGSIFRDRSFGDPNDTNSGLYSSSNYLMYVPTGPDDAAVRFEDGLTYADLMGYFDALGVNPTPGEYTERNSGRNPWNNTLDLRIEQEIPGLFNNHRGAIYLDVRNVLALVDKDSAQQHYSNFADDGKAIVDMTIDPDTLQYVYSPVFRGFNTLPTTRYRPQASTWSAKIGVRYRF